VAQMTRYSGSWRRCGGSVEEVWWLRCGGTVLEIWLLSEKVLWLS
jgi:hypothetical protein